MKLFSLIAMMAIFQTTAHAQRTGGSDSFPDNRGSAIQYGTQVWFLAGPAFSTASVGPVADQNVGTRTGLNVGAEFELPMNPNFSVQTGLDYIQKGGTLGNSTTAFNYLELPVLAKFKLLAGPGDLAFEVGPTLGIAIARTINNGNNSIDASPLYNSFDLGARLGAAYEFPLQDVLSLSIGANYELGLSNVLNNAVAGNANTVKNRTFSALVGLGMKI